VTRSLIVCWPVVEVLSALDKSKIILELFGTFF
jgi:hypothetical protein